MPPDSPEPTPAVSRRGLYIAGFRRRLSPWSSSSSASRRARSPTPSCRNGPRTRRCRSLPSRCRTPRGKTTTFILPGRLEAYTQAQMYARVSGYVKEWKADIGTPVKAGDLLAEIDAPDLDQQIMQAEANLASAKANSVLSDVTLKRGQTLITTYAISQQDLDQRAADASNKQGPRPRGAGQSRSPARARAIQAHRRAVRRAGHRAHDRHRRADQCRRRRRAAAVRRFGHQQAARLCQRPAKLRAQHPGRHQGANRGAGISGQDVSGDGRSVGAGG